MSADVGPIFQAKPAALQTFRPTTFSVWVTGCVTAPAYPPENQNRTPFDLWRTAEKGLLVGPPDLGMPFNEWVAIHSRQTHPDG